MNAIPGVPSLLPSPPSNTPTIPVTSMGTPEGPLESQKPEPRVLGGREITDQRGKTRIVGPFYCSVCHKQFPHKSLTEIHLQCHMEKRLPCPFCDKMFKNKYVLKYHVEGAHNQTVGEPSPQLRRRLEKRSLNTVTCFCGISFETMNSYNEHMRTHQHGAIQVQNEQRVNCHPCPMCKETFSNLFQLVKHMGIHNNNQPSTSPELPVKRIFLSGGATLQITPVPASQTPPSSDTSASPPPISCQQPPPVLQRPPIPMLPRGISTSPRLDHRTSKSSVPSPTRSSSSPPRSTWECEFCEDVTFNLWAVLRGHMHNKHHLYLVCLECHVFLSDINDMTQHMSDAHPDVSVHPCSVCGRCFSDEEAAKTHLDAHKNGLADFSGCFQCSLCEALYDGERECALHEAAHRADSSAILS